MFSFWVSSFALSNSEQTNWWNKSWCYYSTWMWYR